MPGEEQTAPVPTTEAGNGEVEMNPSAESPATDAADHAETLEDSASRPSEVRQSDDPQPAFENLDQKGRVL